MDHRLVEYWVPLRLRVLFTRYYIKPQDLRQVSPPFFGNTFLLVGAKPDANIPKNKISLLWSILRRVDSPLMLWLVSRLVTPLAVLSLIIKKKLTLCLDRTGTSIKIFPLIHHTKSRSHGMGGLGKRTRIGVVVVLRDGNLSYRIIDPRTYWLTIDANRSTAI